MPVYAYKGRTLGGAVENGQMECANRDEVVTQLRRKRVIASYIREQSPAIKLRLPSMGGFRVKVRDLVIFTRQFATMVNAGLPLVQCLDILSKQAESPLFGKLVADVMHDVEAGSTLSESLGKRPKAFDSLFVNMVDAGEAGGILDEILARLATYLEKAEALKRKVKSAMTYPLVVFAVATGATTFMLLVIIPTFAKVFADFGGELPMPTRIVMGLSTFIRGFWWAILLTISVAIAAFKRYHHTAGGRLRVDGLLLRVPVLGSILRRAAIARFTRTLGTMISSGVPILTALDITARTAGNKVIENAIQATKGSIGEGETIAAPLRQAKVFPPMVVQMISVGEETGALDKMLDKIAAFYDEEVDVAVDTLTSVIEPIMIVVMGAMVGGMVVAMYLPMFKLINVVGGSGK
jgi:type IV pilus assembly protein PilC